MNIRGTPFIRYILWVILFLLAIVGLYWLYIVTVLRTPTSFSIVTGREEGAYHFYATEYARELAAIGVTLDVIPTAGSIENLELLNDTEVPVGVVQSGTATEVADPSLYALAGIFYEPIWVFYRQESFAEPLEYLFDLEGKRVGVGEPGSGTQALALDMLELNQVTAQNTTFVDAPAAEAVDLLVRGELDAAFFVLAPISDVVRDLMTTDGLALMNFRRALAYEARFHYLTPFVIGEGALDLRQNLPARDVTILATTAMLVANESLHPDSARQLLTAAIAVHGEGGYFETAGEFPSVANTELPVPASISTFLSVGPTGLERFLPVQVASLVERLFIFVLPAAVLLFPLLRGTPVAYRVANQYRVYRWYTRVRDAEQELESFNRQELDAEISALTELDQRLADGVRVPIFYQRDFYDLRMHLRLVLDRLIQRRDALSAGGVDTDLGAEDHTNSKSMNADEPRTDAAGSEA